MSDKWLRERIKALISDAGNRELLLIWIFARALLGPDEQEAEHGQAD